MAFWSRAAVGWEVHFRKIILAAGVGCIGMGRFRKTRSEVETDVHKRRNQDLS